MIYRWFICWWKILESGIDQETTFGSQWSLEPVILLFSSGVYTTIDHKLIVVCYWLYLYTTLVNIWVNLSTWQLPYHGTQHICVFFSWHTNFIFFSSPIYAGVNMWSTRFFVGDGLKEKYLLVNIQKTMENHNLQLVNQRFQWQFSSSHTVNVYQRVTCPDQWSKCLLKSPSRLVETLDIGSYCWLVVSNMNFVLYGMSSFPLMNLYISRWLKPPTSGSCVFFALGVRDPYSC